MTGLKYVRPHDPGGLNWVHLFSVTLFIIQDVEMSCGDFRRMREYQDSGPSNDRGDTYAIN